VLFSCFGSPSFLFLSGRRRSGFWVGFARGGFLFVVRLALDFHPVLLRVGLRLFFFSPFSHCPFFHRMCAFYLKGTVILTFLAVVRKRSQSPYLLRECSEAHRCFRKDFSNAPITTTISRAWACPLSLILSQCEKGCPPWVSRLFAPPWLVGLFFMAPGGTLAWSLCLLFFPARAKPVLPNFIFFLCFLFSRTDVVFFFSSSIVLSFPPVPPRP